MAYAFFRSVKDLWFQILVPAFWLFSLWICITIKDYYCGKSADMLCAFMPKGQQHNSIDYLSVKA